MAIVVSDTSPIRALSHLGCLAWLGEMFNSVVIPPAVALELRTSPQSGAVIEVSAWSFVTIERPQSSERVMELRVTLDLGEAEAIALAEEISAEAILIDELTGRAVAMKSGLTVVGTLGILLRAKQLRLCSEVKPLMERLQREQGFFISPALLQKVLEQAQEI